MAPNCWPALLASWIAELSWPLDARIAGRLMPLFLGALFAQGRQTVASWLRAMGGGKDFRGYYYFLGSLGRATQWIAGSLLRLVRNVVVPGDRILLALDDTPTRRYGKHVEGAGLHHNPTPGPAEQKFVYGHVFVLLALLARHPLWGTIGLPILSALYVRRVDAAKLPRWRHFSFRTKLELAAELVEWAADRLKTWGKPVWVVVDGFYGKRPFLRRALAAGVTVVGRLRKDAALRSVPKAEPTRRGRRRQYGKERISLAKRAAHRFGWTTAEFVLYGKAVVKTFKSFVATYAPASGAIRVVLVKETSGWIAFFCTDANASVAAILEAVADRFSIEQDFHDLKEVHGVGKQQLRNLSANLGAFNLLGWLHTLIELWAWDRPHAELVDRSASPWDNARRRPSHADRRRALRKACLRAQLQAATLHTPVTRKFRNLLETAFRLAL